MLRFFVLISSVLFLWHRSALIISGHSVWVTDILVFLTMTVAIFYSFEYTRSFFSRFVIIPVFAFSWVVLIVRMLFEVVDITWAWEMGIDTYVEKFFDFTTHMLPVLFFYVFIRCHKEFIIKEVQRNTNGQILLNVLLPSIIVFLWGATNEPAEVYGASFTKNTASLLISIASIFSLVIPIFILDHFVCLPSIRKGKEAVMRYVFSTFLFAFIIIDLCIYGIEDLKENIFLWGMLATLALLYVYFYRKDLYEKYFSILYGFSLSTVLFRESVLLFYKGSHKIFIEQIDQFILPYSRLWYPAMSIGVSIIILLVINELLLQYKEREKTSQKYEYFFMPALYVILNKGFSYYSGEDYILNIVLCIVYFLLSFMSYALVRK